MCGNVRRVSCRRLDSLVGQEDHECVLAIVRIHFEEYK